MSFLLSRVAHFFLFIEMATRFEGQGCVDVERHNTTIIQNMSGINQNVYNEDTNGKKKWRKKTYNLFGLLYLIFKRERQWKKIHFRRCSRSIWNHFYWGKSYIFVSGQQQFIRVQVSLFCALMF